MKSLSWETGRNGSVRLANWLDKQGVYFALRQKKSTYIQQPGEDYQLLGSLGLAPGMKMFLTGVKVTKQKGFGCIHSTTCLSLKKVN